MCHWRPPKVRLDDRMIGSAAWPVRNYASFCTGLAANPNLALIRRLFSGRQWHTKKATILP